MELRTKSQKIVSAKVKSKYQFIFPVNDKYLEIDRDFVWTGFARYGYTVGTTGQDDAFEMLGSYDERIVWINQLPLLLPNFFDFQLYVNDRKLFNNPINFRAIPSIEHKLVLPCEYYLPKGTKIFCNTPFVGSYFPDPALCPAGVLDDYTAFERRNITLFLDGYEVDELDREIIQTLQKPYIYQIGGYFAGTGADDVSDPNWPIASWIAQMVAETQMGAWPRANNEQFTLESQILLFNKDNPLPVKFERDCQMTKIWRYDWQWFYDGQSLQGTPGFTEGYIEDFKLTFPILPTKFYGDITDASLDLIRNVPCHHWTLTGYTQEHIHQMMYSRVQKRDMHHYLYQRDRDLREILAAQHIPTCNMPRKIVPLRKRMSNSDVWNIKMYWDELLEHDGTEDGTIIFYDPEGQRTTRIDSDKHYYVKRLILIGVKEFPNE